MKKIVPLKVMLWTLLAIIMHTVKKTDTKLSFIGRVILNVKIGHIFYVRVYYMVNV